MILQLEFCEYLCNFSSYVRFYVGKYENLVLRKTRLKIWLFLNSVLSMCLQEINMSLFPHIVRLLIYENNQLNIIFKTI